MSVSSTVTSLTNSTAVSTSTTTSTTTSSESSALFDNYEAFLTLLTTQLQNQDPLDPMDTAEFTNQLVQYADVEQAIKTNETLDSILSLTSWNTNTLALSYVGKTVEYDSEYAALADGSATWNYELDDDASAVTLTVKDQNGNVIYTESGETDSGDHQFTWDGTDSDGNVLEDGTYSLTVTAVDSSGAEVESSVTSIGKISNVDTSGDEIALYVGDIAITVDEIVAFDA
ncbi:flagellar hook assembly protein FlgD [Dongia sp.]|uniref:flagellar hook assembly protein FlgD n=1 Tax=Dongia sp. TaxID=1977262 RepID=UPI0035B40CA0